MRENQKMTAMQDPDRGYFVVLNPDHIYGENHLVIPLDEGEFYIGRARNNNILVNCVTRLGIDKGAIWLPKHPGPNTVVPVGKIIVDRKHIRIVSGWEGQDARENIKILRADEITSSYKQRSHQSLDLEGFEVVRFQGVPEIDVRYIPPITGVEQTLHNSTIIDKLESYGLWASAAIAWEHKTQWNRSLECWNNALEISQRVRCPLLEQANIYLGLSRAGRHLGASSDEVNEFLYHAANLLGLPLISYNSSGKIAVQGRPIRLSLFVRNLSQHGSADGIKLFYSCHDLGIYKSFSHEDDLVPGSERSWNFWVKGMPKVGKYIAKVEVSIHTASIHTAIRDVYQYNFEDFVEIVRERPKVNVEGDAGLIKVQVDDDDVVPDVHVGRDVGAVVLRVVRK